MDPATVAAVMGGASAGTSLLTSQQNIKAASDAADKQINFQERMSNTSYQRAKQDMEAAGLNPALMYNQGGASTPGGAALMSEAENPLEGLAASAKDIVNLNQEKDKRAKEIQLTGEMAKTQETQQGLNKASAKAAQEAAKASLAQGIKTLTESKIMDKNMGAIEAKAKLDEAESKLREKTLMYDYGAEKIQQLLGAAASAKDLGKVSIPYKTPGKTSDGTYYDKKTGEVLYRK